MSSGNGTHKDIFGFSVCGRLIGVTSDVFTLEYVQSELRFSLPFFAIASVVLVAGTSSLVLAAVRSCDRLLFWLGILSTLYGVRLFVENHLVETAIGADRENILLWTRCLTYIIPIPYALFARELLGSGWKESISIWLWIEVAFAVIAIPAAFLNYRLGWIELANSSLVVGGTILILLHIILRHEASSSFATGLTWPLVVFGIFVLLANRGYRPPRVNFEPLGFMALLGGLGLTAFRRSVLREKKLLEVEQELTTARRIQSSIIPNSSPKLSGIKIAMRYQPMSAVAGDFFDFLQIGDHSLTILVADVSGHGVPAALIASMLKVCFAAQRDRAKNPAEILKGLNTMLSSSMAGHYVTAACAAIDLAEHTVTYAGAGHPPSPLLRKKTGEVVQLAENGLFLGPFAHATYSNMTVTFETGDKLLLYTDGIVEALDRMAKNWA